MPEFVVLIAVLLGTAALLFVYVKRRVGPWLALFAAVVAALPRPRLGGAALALRDHLRRPGLLRPGDAAGARTRRPPRRHRRLPLPRRSLSASPVSACPSSSAPRSRSRLGPRERWLRPRLRRRRPRRRSSPSGTSAGVTRPQPHVSLHNVLASPRFVAERWPSRSARCSGSAPTRPAARSTAVWGRAILVALVLGIGVLVYRRCSGRPRLLPGPLAGGRGGRDQLAPDRLQRAPGPRPDRQPLPVRERRLHPR